MTTFVLVHEAFHGGWCWKSVRERLKGKGHDVFCLTLTGVGDRHHLLTPEVDLWTHVEDVVNLMRWEELSEVVLLGHSYGGMVAGHVADRVPERIRHLVFLDAVIPENGKRLIDLVPDLGELFLKQAADQGDGWKVPPMPAAAFIDNVGEREWVDRLLTDHPLACFQTAGSLQNPVGTVPSSYILARDFSPSPLIPFAKKAQEWGWKMCELAGSHDLMIDNPEEVSQFLADLA